MSVRQWLDQAIICLCLLAVVLFGIRIVDGVRHCKAHGTCPWGAR